MMNFLLKYYKTINQSINIIMDLKNINKHAKLILKTSITVCLLLATLAFVLHIGAPYSTDYLSIVSYRGQLIEAVGAMFLLGVIFCLFGDLILRKKMGPENHDDDDPDRKNDKL